MTEIMVTAHAAARYVERVNPRLSEIEAIAAIKQSDRAIRAAAIFGSRTVRRADGVRFVLDGFTVITVLDKSLGRFGVFPRKAVAEAFHDR